MSHPVPPGRPLAWHLGVLCTALLVPMLALGSFLLFRMAAAEQARHEDVAHEAARRFAVALDRGLTTYRAMLEVLATSDYLAGNNIAAFMRRAREVPRPAGAEFLLCNASGQPLGGTGEPWLAPQAEAHLADAMHRANATGRSQISDLILPEQPGTSPAFAVVAPVADKRGQTQRLLILIIPTAVLAELLPPSELPAGMTATLADRQGMVVAHSAAPARYVGLRLPAPTRDGMGEHDQGWLRTIADDGQPVVAAFARSAIAGWTTIVSLPEAAFAALFQRSLLLAGAAALALACLAGALALGFARRIARPIEALAGLTATGADLALATPVREVNALAGAFAAAQEERQRRAAEREALLATLQYAQVFVRAPDGTVTLWTAGMQRLFGWTRAQALGQVSHRLLATEFPCPLAEIEAALLAHGEWRGELRHRRNDGAVVVVASHWALRRGEDGAPIAVVEACNDVTALHEAEAALRRNRDLLSSVLQGSADPIFAKDREGRYVILNPPAAELLGCSVAEALGRRIGELVPPGLAGATEAADREVAAAGEVRVREEEVARPEGEPRILLTTRAPWRDAAGATLGIVGVSRDITARRQAEARLRKAQAELFQVARVNAMGAMGSALAHELNQPLTAAANFAEAATLMLARPPDEVQLAAARGAMAEAAGEVVRAGQILRRLREFVGRGDTEKAPAAINAIVEQAVLLALPGWPEPGLALQLRLGAALPPVLVDAVQLQQVIINLVRNAAEAMRDSPRRELSVTTALHDADWLEVSLADTGPGLARELEGRLFQPFVTTKRDGMGIGLSICRSIINGHGGVLEAAARPGGGAVFRFRLPSLRPDEETCNASGEDGHADRARGG